MIGPKINNESNQSTSMVKRALIKGLVISAGLFRPAYSVYRYLNWPELCRFRQELSFYSTLLEPGSICFDVGANIGKKSEIFLKLGMTVVAFEPQSGCIRELRARCGFAQKRLHTWQGVVGEKIGDVSLHLSEESNGQASLLADWEGTHAGTIRVPMTTLDDAIGKYGKPAYVKIDVEGYELNVLKGLSSSVPLVSFEYHLREREINEVYNCLDCLSQFGEMQVNLVPSNSMEFAFEKWRNLDEFRYAFPEDFRNRDGYFYGDIFVKTSSNGSFGFSHVI